MSSETTYYHGGKIGLSPGDALKSAADLGIQTASDAADDLYSPSLIYVTTDERVAVAYAEVHIAPEAWRIMRSGEPYDPADLNQYRGGAVYEVEIAGEPSPDRDSPLSEGVDLQVASATVVKVVRKRVPSDISGHRMESLVRFYGRDEARAAVLAITRPTEPKGAQSKNSLCACGSGKKYKLCHGKSE